MLWKNIKYNLFMLASKEEKYQFSSEKGALWLIKRPKSSKKWLFLGGFPPRGTP